jgi:hypothetical protein
MVESRHGLPPVATALHLAAPGALQRRQARSRPSNAWLRGYAYAFIHTFAPSLTREVVERALCAEPGQDGGL